MASETTPPPQPLTAVQHPLLKRPLYVYNLPPTLLSTLSPLDAATSTAFAISPATHTPPPPKPRAPIGDASILTATSCALCTTTQTTVAEQRTHIKSDFHTFNLKRRARGQPAVAESTFNQMAEGTMDESLSGSDDGSDEGEELAGELQKKAVINAAGGKGGMAPIVWFASPELPPDTAMGVYKALFTPAETAGGGDFTAVLAAKQKQQEIKTSPHVFMCMIGGGHFAAILATLTPKPGNDRQPTILASKTFHRYTTRRKQGGSQAASDAARGAAHSAGSSLRRYNEAALTAEVRELLAQWQEQIDGAVLCFVRATGTNNRKTLFGYEGAVLRNDDPRVRGLPFSTRRATQSELVRAWGELCRAKIEPIVATSPPTISTSKPATPTPAKPEPVQPSQEDLDKILHTTQLIAFIKRSKAPALLAYLSTNSLSPSFRFHPQGAHYHAPTPLHLAASMNAHALVTALLMKADANPGVANADGKTPFELAGDRATRDAFRVARSALGEDKWEWGNAKVPAGLSAQEVREREKREGAERKKEELDEKKRRDAEMERIQGEEGKSRKIGGRGGSTLGRGGVKVMSGLEMLKGEVGLRGMTPEDRQKLERERRARAAEERIKNMMGRK